MKTNQDIAMELAHRTCTKYLHVPDSSSIQYSFSARHLADFVEKLVAAVDAERGKAQLPVGFVDHGGIVYWHNKENKPPANDTQLFLSPTIPPNMALVPVEPTKEIRIAIWDALTEQRPSLDGVWEKLIQAAGVTK